jgi:hypothetical protein
MEELAPRHTVCQELKAIAARLLGDEGKSAGSGLKWIKRLVGKS